MADAFFEALVEADNRKRAAQAPPAVPRRERTETGLISEGFILRCLIAFIHEVTVLLMLMSVIGTFYGTRGLDAPLAHPIQIVLDAVQAPMLLLLAAAGQGLLSLVQWGARLAALKLDPRWWVAYVLSLGVSAWWNWNAYADPMIALGVPWLIAGAFLLGADALPEWLLIKKR